MTSRWLASTCLAALAVAASPVLAQDRAPARLQTRNGGHDASPRRVNLNVSLTVNGLPAGDVPVETDTSGYAAVNVDQLLARISPIVDRSVVDMILQRAAGRSMVPVSELASDRLVLEFSMATLQLTATVPTEARATNVVSIANQTPALVNTPLPPNSPTAGITVFLGQRFLSDKRFHFDRQPFTALVEGFTNIGGVEGLNLRFLTGYQENGSFVRSRTTLFHDDPRSAIRYSLGDIDPQTFGSFAPATSVLGIGVERLYQEIQPYRNIRPSGQGALSLDRPSRVDVLVNGTIYRTLNLAPGRYDLRDFPYLDGFNDVRLVVQDDAGRQESIVVSFFSDATLLEPGLSIFSATVGLPRTQFAPFTNTGYRDEPAINGFYQRGITDNLTLGGSIQADRRNGLLGALAVIGSRIGTFAFESSLDFARDESLQWAAVGSYRFNLPTETNQLRAIDAQVIYRSPRFSPMFEVFGQRTQYSLETNFRVQTPLAEKIYGTFGGGYSRARTAASDLWTASAGISRTFGRVVANANYTFRKDSLGTDHRGLFSISIPLSSRQSARASYDTRRNRTRLDYDLQSLEELNSTRLRASLGRDDLGSEAFVDAEHFSNRFRAGFRHEYFNESGFTQQMTDLALTFGVGFADGQLALGREAGRGFVIVDGHPTMGGAPILVSSRSTLGPVARTGPLGPALVPLQRGYRPESLVVKVPDLRPGYDIGSGRFDILPGAASGYRWIIGSAASNLVIGQLVGHDGAALAFVAGTLRPISGKEAQPVPFFTNRTGRLVAQRVAPGRYAIVPNGSDTAVGEVTIPENATGPIEIGVITMDGAGT